MKPFKIAIAGLGTVGGGVVKALAERGDDLSARAGRKLEIVAVSARDPNKARGFAVTNFVADPLALASGAEVPVTIPTTEARAAAAAIAARSVSVDAVSLAATYLLLPHTRMCVRTSHLFAPCMHTLNKLPFPAAGARRPCAPAPHRDCQGGAACNHHNWCCRHPRARASPCLRAPHCHRCACARAEAQTRLTAVGYPACGWAATGAQLCGGLQFLPRLAGVLML